MNAQVPWVWLHTFAEVARLGSFSLAAARLTVHPSTVSRQMTELEGTLSTRLFERLPRGVRLTAAGEVLHERVGAMEEHALAAVASVQGRDVAIQGRVRFTSTPEVMSWVMPLLADFRLRTPAVVLEVDAAVTRRDLSRWESDVALRAGATPPDDAIAHRIAPVSWGVYARRDAQAELPWLDLRPAYSRLPKPRGPVAMTVTRVSTAIQAVRAGIGRAPLPTFLADGHPELHCSEVVSELTTDSLWLLVHPENRRVARVRALVDHLRRGLTVKFSEPDG